MIYYILSVFLFVSTLHATEYEKIENVVIDHQNKLMWQDNVEVTEYLETFVSAEVYCETTILNGYIDWRVPTINEVIRIIDVKNKDSIVKEFENIQPQTYRTNTVLSQTPQMNWGVDFKMGKIVLVEKNAKNYIRCVRDI